MSDTLFGFPIEEPANQDRPEWLDQLKFGDWSTYFEVKARAGPCLSPEGFVQLLQRDGVTLPARLGDIARVTDWPLHRAFHMCDRLGFGFSIPSHLIAGSVSSIVDDDEFLKTVSLEVVLDESITVFLNEEDTGGESEGWPSNRPGKLIEKE